MTCSFQSFFIPTNSMQAQDATEEEKWSCINVQDVGKSEVPM